MKVAVGPGHAPLPEFAVWKETLLAVILCLCLVELIARGRSGFRILTRMDVLDVLILILLGLSIVLPIAIGLAFHPAQWLLGFKYDFIPLVAFLMLRRVPWSDFFRKRVTQVILWAGVAVATYGIATLFLPDSFFLWLGYSPLHSLYIPEGPLAAFQYIGGTSVARIQSTMSGPNQLGLWLLLPLSILLSRMLKGSVSRFWFPVSCLLLGALVLTFSRAAWIAAAVITIVVAFLSLPRRAFWKFSAIGGAALAACLLIVALVAPQILSRVTSNREHLARPLAAMQQMIAHPFGQGLGTAGPATNRTGDACVYLERGADASWAKDQPNLCVFVGKNQVQPPERTCTCPFLPENWYLQIGVELGVLGFLLYVTLITIVLYRLWKGRKDPWGFPIFLAFFGISIAALFLHAWEDAAVAYTVWIFAAVELRCKENK